jgi:hypothetical protein
MSQHMCSAPPRVAHQYGGFGGLEQNYDVQSSGNVPDAV